ncbi:hypothetical protein MUK42_28455 [Musa troglodytarum]|uniref:Transcription repressor n=1 Tax=Musa troglodytarum TaxID=320322 RepID=A0A9E7EZK7_9LILI|nr:hypothetical protein MUK42_28455 [Musa troglodytarum]
MEIDGSRSGGSTGRRLKQRLARMFLRSSCNTSTSAASAGAEPVFEVEHRDHGLGRRSLSFFVPGDHRRHTAVAVALPRSVDCGGRGPSRQSASSMDKNEKWKDSKGRKKENADSPPSPRKSSYYHHCIDKAMGERKEIKRKKKKRLLSNGYGFSSSSSTESDQDDGFFSSEEREGKEEEAEAFFSSRSFSSDSCDFYQRPTSNKKRNKNNKKKEPERPPRRRRRRGGSKHAAWGVCKGLQPLVSVRSPAAKNGVAVVKRSRDPYTDFRSSMAEMITERQIFEAEDLESLLQSYLSLNSPHLHLVILQAFSDIWVVLFGH